MKNSPNDATPTIRDLAKACGISRTTISLALRNSPKVSPETRAMVQRRAKELGYELDARVSQLMGYLRQRHKSRAVCNLAWLNSGDQQGWKKPWNREVLEGAQQRAEELGYSLEEIWIRDPEFNLKRLPQILRARGIEGVLLPNPGMANQIIRDSLAWNEIHAVVLMAPGAFLELNHAEKNQSENLKILLKKLVSLGYRRPGLLISRWIDLHHNFVLSGQLLADHGPYLKFDRIPPFWNEGWKGETWDPVEFQKWLKQWKPDVLLVSNNEWLSILEQMKIRVPQDIGLAHLHWADDVKDWAGIDPRQKYIGAAAIDLLTSHLVRGEKGIPPYPKEVQIHGVWRMGKTVRANFSMRS